MVWRCYSRSTIHPTWNGGSAPCLPGACFSPRSSDSTWDGPLFVRVGFDATAGTAHHSAVRPGASTRPNLANRHRPGDAVHDQGEHGGTDFDVSQGTIRQFCYLRVW